MGVKPPFRLIFKFMRGHMHLLALTNSTTDSEKIDTELTQFFFSERAIQIAVVAHSNGWPGDAETPSAAEIR